MLTGAELARRAGVSRQNVSNLARSGRLPRIRGPEGEILYDENSPEIKAYIEEIHQVPRPRLQSSHNAATPSSENTYTTPLDDDISRTSSERRLAAAKASRAELALSREMGRVLDTDIVEKSFSVLAQILDEELDAFDEREGVALFQAARGVNATEVQWAELLHEAIRKSRSRIIKNVQVEVRKLKEMG